MSRWPLKPLGEICSTTSGGTPSRSHPEYFGGAIPWIKSGDLTDGDVIACDENITEEAIRSSSAKLFPKGTVLIAMYGATVGKLGMLGIEAATNQAVCGITPSDKLDRWFLFFFLLSQRKNLIGQSAGGAQPNISQKIVRELHVPVPPLPEQRRIVDLLSRAEGIVRLRREADKKAAELIPALFLDMFGDPASNPKGWEKAPLTAACASADDIKCGPFGTQLAKSEFRHEGVPLWGIKHVNVGFSIPTVEFLSIEKATELSMYSILPGDIVMTRKGTIGNCALYQERMPSGVMHSDLLRIRPDTNRCSPQFISDQLQISRDVEHQIAKTASSGAVMPGINVGRLKSVQIFVPPIATQQRYVEQVRQIHSIQFQQSSATARAKSTFDALLAEAFSNFYTAR